jgi:hypothetical protein
LSCTQIDSETARHLNSEKRPKHAIRARQGIFELAVGDDFTVGILYVNRPMPVDLDAFLLPLGRGRNLRGRVGACLPGFRPRALRLRPARPRQNQDHRRECNQSKNPPSPTYHVSSVYSLAHFPSPFFRFVRVP